jgi:hypothetical protein
LNGPGGFWQPTSTHYLLGACYQAVETAGRGAPCLAHGDRNQSTVEPVVANHGGRVRKGTIFSGGAAELATRALELAPGDLNSYLLAIKAHQDAGLYDVTIEIARKAVAGFHDRRGRASSMAFTFRRLAGPMRRLPS